jgi:hypothetical protein
VRENRTHGLEGGEVSSLLYPYHETVDKNHGRLEIRRYSLSAQIDWLEQKLEWKVWQLSALIFGKSKS